MTPTYQGGSPGRRVRTQKKRSPAYQWYPNDWALDEIVSDLSNEAYGLFHRLYDRAWMNDGLPAEVDKIFAHARCESRDRFDQLWMTIAPLFPPSPDGRHRNPQQEAQRKKQRNNSRERKLAAKKRWERNQIQSDAIAHANAYAFADPNAHASASVLQCLSLALSLALSDLRSRSKAGEQRDGRRAKPLRMSLDVYEVRGHLLAATHKLLTEGPPDGSGPCRDAATGQPDLGAIAHWLKDAARALDASWMHAHDLDRIMHAAIGRQQSLLAAGTARDRADAREHASLRRERQQTTKQLRRHG